MNFNEINSYYSSDEDVAWGPITLREIKREFSIPKKKPLVRKTDFPLDCKKCQDLQTSESIISTNTDYCTANETVESDFKTDQKNDEMKNIASSLNTNETVDFSKELVSSNQISKEKECLDADAALICVCSDELNEDFEHFMVKTEDTNLSNIDIISLSSDDERDSSNEKWHEIDVGVVNLFEENNKLPNKSILVNEKTRSSICSSNRTSDYASENNFSIDEYSTGDSIPDDSMKKHCPRYRLSKTSKSSANENKNIESNSTSTTANDLSRKQYLRCGKSQSCISSLNESTKSLENIVGGKNTEYQFDIYEAAINANSTNNRERSQLAEFMSLSTHECEVDKRESILDFDISNHIENISSHKSIGGLITSDSIKKNSLESENFGVTSTEIDYKNHVYKFSKDEYLELPSKLGKHGVFSNISSSEVDDKHKYEFNNSDAFEDLNSEYSSGSELSYNEDGYFLDNTLSVIENLMKNGLEMNAATDDINQTNLKYSVESNKSLSHIEEPISRIPIFLSASNESKYTSMSSVADFKIPNPKNVKKYPNVDKKLTPIKKSPNVFKNIISPVRMYIKNSSMPVLKQTHKPIMVDHTLSIIPETSISKPINHRNLVKSLPEVIYRPSKKVIEKSDNEIILPDNIRKLVKERIVIKHEIRTKVDLNESELTTSEKLQRADISCVMNDERNMSLHTAKQGFNI